MTKSNLVVVLFGLLIASVGLFSPKHPIADCVRIRPLAFGATLAENCDTKNIAREIAALDDYLTADRTASRTRPTSIVADAIAEHVFAPVIGPAARQLGKTLDGSTAQLAYLVVGVLTNLAILALAHQWYIRLIGTKRFADQLALMGVIASSDIVVAWFWVPHQSFMNLLVPIGGVFAFCEGMKSSFMPNRRLLLYGLATAAFCLWYGYCLIWPVAFVLGMALALAYPPYPGRVPQLRRVVVYSSGVVLPLVLWFGAYALAGKEIAYEAQSVGQFQWLPDAWRAHRIGAALLTQAATTAEALRRDLSWGGLVAMLAVMAAAATALAQAGGRRTFRDGVILGVVVTFWLMLLFNYFQGYPQARLLIFPLLLASLAGFRLLHVARVENYVVPIATVLTVAQVVLALTRTPVTFE